VSKPFVAWFGLFLLTGCELREVQIALPEDIVIAEIILRPSQNTQRAFLHRTRGSGAPAAVDGAVIEVRGEDPRVMAFAQTQEGQCVGQFSNIPEGSQGSCYLSGAGEASLPILPGETYHLTITLADGRRMTGVTTVPNDFQLLRPNTQLCTVPEMTTLELSWTRSPGAWVYAAETNLRGITGALQPHNIRVDEDPLRLFGLSLSASDTTITFPSEFGLFDRFDEDLTEALVFLQKGLPRGVFADVTVAAADRNYVNWERGGNFNPSGFVRVPSISGAGSGVFGSLVSKSFQVAVEDPRRPPC
jgi:hypothetical protein